MNETFVSAYTMETLKADTARVDHAKMNRRYLALIRLGRIKNAISQTSP